MNENTKTPLEILTDTLAAMTERAIKAEKERDEAKTKQLDWYKSWERKDRDYKELQATLASEIREHQKTKSELEDVMHAITVLTEELERSQRPDPAPQA